MKSRKSIVSTMATLLMIIAALFFVGCDNGNGGGGTILSNGTNAPTNPSGGGGASITVIKSDGTVIPGFEDITLAIEEAAKNDGSTVKLEADITQNITFPEGNFTLDLNGFTLKGSTPDWQIPPPPPVISNSGTLTIVDTSTTKSGVIEIPSPYYEYGHYYAVSGISGGTIIFKGGTIQGRDTPGSAIAASSVTMDGGNIISTFNRYTTSKQCGISASSVTMKSGSITLEGTYIRSGGNTIYGINANNVTMEGGSISIKSPTDIIIDGEGVLDQYKAIAKGIHVSLSGSEVLRALTISGGEISVEAGQAYGIIAEFTADSTPLLYLLGDPTIVARTADISGYFALAAQPTNTQPYSYKPISDHGTYGTYLASGSLKSSDSYTITEADLTKFKSSHEDYELKFYPDGYPKPEIRSVKKIATE